MTNNEFLMLGILIGMLMVLTMWYLSHKSRERYLIQVAQSEACTRLGDGNFYYFLGEGKYVRLAQEMPELARQVCAEMCLEYAKTLQPVSNWTGVTPTQIAETCSTIIHDSETFSMLMAQKVKETYGNS